MNSSIPEVPPVLFSSWVGPLSIRKGVVDILVKLIAIAVPVLPLHRWWEVYLGIAMVQLLVITDLAIGFHPDLGIIPKQWFLDILVLLFFRFFQIG